MRHRAPRTRRCFPPATATPGIYASGLTPLILASLVAAGHGVPWYACGYLVATAVLSVGATLLLNPR